MDVSYNPASCCVAEGELVIVGIGTDLVSISRIGAVLERRPTFAQRILTAYELEIFNKEINPAAYLAKRFAAKEAIAKALGCGIGARMSWQDVETRRGPSGAPEVSLKGAAWAQMQALGASRCHLSMSDEVSVALAFAVIETD